MNICMNCIHSSIEWDTKISFSPSGKLIPKIVVFGKCRSVDAIQESLTSPVSGFAPDELPATRDCLETNPRGDCRFFEEKPAAKPSVHEILQAVASALSEDKPWCAEVEPEGVDGRATGRKRITICIGEDPSSLLPDRLEHRKR